MATKRARAKRAARRPRPPAVAGSTQAEIETQLANVRARLADPDTSASAHLKLVTELRGFLKLRTELERRDAELENRIAHHPTWVTLRDEMVKIMAVCEHCAPLIEALLAAQVQP
jgi:hypothetical protein